MLLGEYTFESAAATSLREFMPAIVKQLTPDSAVRQKIIDSANHFCRSHPSQLCNTEDFKRELRQKAHSSLFCNLETEVLVESEDDLHRLFDLAQSNNVVGQLIIGVFGMTARRLAKSAKPGTAIGDDGQPASDEIMALTPDDRTLHFPSHNMFHSLGKADIFTVNDALPTVRDHGYLTAVDTDVIAAVKAALPSKEDERIARLTEQSEQLAAHVMQTSSQVKHLADVMHTRLKNAVPEPLQHAQPQGGVMAVQDDVPRPPPAGVIQSGTPRPQPRFKPRMASVDRGVTKKPRLPLRTAVGRAINSSTYRYMNKPASKYVALGEAMKAHYATQHGIESAEEYEKRGDDPCPDCGGPEHATHTLNRCLKGWFSTKEGEQYKGADAAREYVRKFLQNVEGGEKVLTIDDDDECGYCDVMDAIDAIDAEMLLIRDDAEYNTTSAYFVDAVAPCMMMARTNMQNDVQTIAHSSGAMLLLANAVSEDTLR
jgi:hypothetical protein